MISSNTYQGTTKINPEEGEPEIKTDQYKKEAVKEEYQPAPSDCLGGFMSDYKKHTAKKIEKKNF
jgi:hypothetical protein